MINIDTKLPTTKTTFSAVNLPKVDFRHVINLTDQTGIFQHALFDMPNRKEGYCIDDNARALLLMVLAAKDKSNKTPTQLLSIYLSFIHYMQTPDGNFLNFMSYSKTTHEERGSQDSFGRTMLALGFLINEGPTHLLVRTAQDIFTRAYPQVKKLSSIRGIANSIIGICQYIKFNYPDDIKRDMVIYLADKLVSDYYINKSSTWQWFEPILTYDNAMLPLSLLNAYEITSNKEYFLVALEAMNFLESKVIVNDKLRPVGNDGWYEKDGTPAKFDQQGIDVMAMVMYYQQAYRLTRDKVYKDRMILCHQWFLGLNDLSMPLYDPSNGASADGLHSEGINLNQGAESTLAYWISHIILDATLKD